MGTRYPVPPKTKEAADFHKKKLKEPVQHKCNHLYFKPQHGKVLYYGSVTPVKIL